MEFAFWKRELEDPAMLILTHAVRQSDSAVTGESPITHRAQNHIADVASIHGMGKHSQASPGSPKKKIADQLRDYSITMTMALTLPIVAALSLAQAFKQAHAQAGFALATQERISVLFALSPRMGLMTMVRRAARA
jgi:hypothetical protein